MERPEGRFGPLLGWARERLDEPLTVERLAERAAMSPRNFARRFAEETGVTPARAIERLRVEAARERVEGGRRADRGDRAGRGSAIPSACGARSCALMASRRRRCGAPPRRTRDGSGCGFHPFETAGEVVLQIFDIFEADRKAQRRAAGAQRVAVRLRAQSKGMTRLSKPPHE